MEVNSEHRDKRKFSHRCASKEILIYLFSFDFIKLIYYIIFNVRSSLSLSLSIPLDDRDRFLFGAFTSVIFL